MLPPMFGTKIFRVATVIVSTASLLVLSGCDDLAKQAGYEKPPTAKQSTPTHRFAPYTHNDDIAFDTQTGQMCRTWDWSPVAPAAKQTPEGGFPERKAGEFAPTCLSLFKQYPTTGNAAIGIIQDSGASQ